MWLICTTPEPIASLLRKLTVRLLISFSGLMHGCHWEFQDIYVAFSSRKHLEIMNTDSEYQRYVIAMNLHVHSKCKSYE